MNKILNSGLDLIYPDGIYCICCEDVLPYPNLHKHGLCDSCINNISWVLENEFNKKLNEFSFDRVISLAYYDRFTEAIIYALKFKGKAYYAGFIGSLLAELLEAEGLSDYELVYVPMHKDKERMRGYNQAELLAKEIASASKCKLIKDGLLKIKETSSMRTARSDGRQDALIGSIIANPSLNFADKKIVLVDDVITTGKTMDFCSQILKSAGAKEVIALSFAMVKYIEK